MGHKSIKHRRKEHKVSRRFIGDAWTRPEGTATTTRDGFVIPSQNIGPTQGNPISDSQYWVSMISLNWVELRSMYRSNWLARRIIDLEPEDMLRAGFDIKGDIDPEDMEDIYTEWANKDINQILFKGLSWARLFGGAIVYVEILGQDSSTPLRLETIDKDQLVCLKVYDRWQLVPSVELDPEDGEPENYSVIKQTGEDMSLYWNKSGAFIRTAENLTLLTSIVHKSRLIKLDGDPLPLWDWINNLRWGASVLEGMQDILAYYNQSTASLSSMIRKASFTVLKVKNLNESIAQSTQGEAYQILANSSAAMAYTQGLEGNTIIDVEDEIEVLSYSFTGVSDLINQQQKQISASKGYPQIKLFNESPKGMSSNGESDIRLYYDQILAKQEANLRNGFMFLLNVIYRSKFGEEPPENLSFKFRPLWQMDEAEKSTIAANVTNAVNAALETGILDLETARKELRQSSETTGIFTNISDKLIADAANDEPPAPGEDDAANDAPIAAKAPIKVSTATAKTES